MRAVFDRDVALRGAVGDFGDVTAHCGWWVDEGCSHLDCEAVGSVRVVGSPVLGPVVEETGVEAAASGCAAFEEDVGEGGGQVVYYAVQTEDVGVGLGGAGHFVDGAVVVPFHVLDVGGVEEVGDEVDDEVLDFGESQVEHELGAGQGSGVVAGVEGPFGVLVVESGVGVDHLRFDPDTELKSRGGVCNGDVIDLLDEWVQAVGELGWVGCPVSKTHGVVVSWVLNTKPTIIHDEKRQAQIRTLSSKLDDGRIVDIGTKSLPRVEKNWTSLLGLLGARKVVAVQVMERARHASHTLSGVDGDGFWGGPGLARCDR